MKTTNNAKYHDYEWFGCKKAEVIEKQEAAGQKEFVDALQLPLTVNRPRGINVVEQYQKMGIRTFVPSKGDELFIGVKLPNGWKKEATDHSMWSNLIDTEGRVRATIFYKASFHDRDSFINFKQRYINTYDYVDLKDPNNSSKFYCVKDQATDETLFKTETTTEYYDYKLEQKCIDFLEKNYPEYEDLNAYWG